MINNNLVLNNQFLEVQLLASRLLRLTPDQTIQVQTLAGDIVLRSYSHIASSSLHSGAQMSYGIFSCATLAFLQGD